jgi:hypothetical protein
VLTDGRVLRSPVPPVRLPPAALIEENAEELDALIVALKDEVRTVAASLSVVGEV